jgi:nicotinate-nucleotide adenylyltransferase
VGIFGGSFNPVHLAHLILAERVRSERSLDTVLFIPARTPPHKASEPLAEGVDRLRMVELAIEGHPAFEALPIEIERSGPSFTLLTVRELRRRYGEGAQLFLLLGGDSLADLPNWWRAGELVEEADVIAFDRPGCLLDDHLPRMGAVFGEPWVRRTAELKVRAPLVEISATEVRQRVRAGKSVRYLVPEPVRHYILERGIYAGA